MNAEERRIDDKNSVDHDEREIFTSYFRFFK